MLSHTEGLGRHEQVRCGSLDIHDAACSAVSGEVREQLETRGETSTGSQPRLSRYSAGTRFFSVLVEAQAACVWIPTSLGKGRVKRTPIPTASVTVVHVS